MLLLNCRVCSRFCSSRILESERIFGGSFCLSSLLVFLGNFPTLASRLQEDDVSDVLDLSSLGLV